MKSQHDEKVKKGKLKPSSDTNSTPSTPMKSTPTTKTGENSLDSNKKENGKKEDLIDVGYVPLSSLPKGTFIKAKNSKKLVSVAYELVYGKIKAIEEDVATLELVSKTNEGYYKSTQQEFKLQIQSDSLVFPLQMTPVKGKRACYMCTQDT